MGAARSVVAKDEILQAKVPYLNVKFFIIRAVIYFAFWMFCVWTLNSWSAEQDRAELATEQAGVVRFRTLSAPGLLFLVLTITFAVTDWVMSLDPHWFSTIFGLMFTAGFGLSALALTTVVLSTVGPSGALAGHLAPRHFHDFGKLLLAFTMLWAYLNFSQFLIIWSGNLPEEIPWYIERMHGGWGVVAVALVVGHFFLPFLQQIGNGFCRRLGKLPGTVLLQEGQEEVPDRRGHRHDAQVPCMRSMSRGISSGRLPDQMIRNCEKFRDAHNIVKARSSLPKS